MEVELREHWGVNVATKKPEKVPHYRVFVEGRSVGYMGWHDGAKLCLVERFGPRERDKIAAKVSELLSKQNVGVSSVPDVPPELLNPNREEYDDHDDIDTFRDSGTEAEDV